MTNLEFTTLSAVQGAARSITKELDNENSKSLAIRAALAVLPEIYKSLPNAEGCVKRSLDVGIEFAKQAEKLKP